MASDTTDTTPANNTASLNTLVGPLPTNTPTLTATLTPTATATATGTATPTSTSTATVTGPPTTTPTSTVTPTATPSRIPGDINGDAFVDIRDYGVWRQQFGAMNCGNPADLNGDCVVDIRDYGIWRQHFGEGTPPAAPRGTPGPGVPTGDLPRDRSWPLLGSEGPPRAVPVIPEADGLSLLAGGLLAVGGLVGWRGRRSNRPR